MERLDPKQLESVKKMSQVRLLLKLSQAGYPEEQLEKMERQDLLNLWAECILAGKDVTPPVAAATPTASLGYDVELERQKLQLETRRFEAQEKARVEEISRLEKIRLEEISRLEKARVADEKIRLEEISRLEKARVADERMHRDEIARLEKIRLDEIARQEEIRLNEVRRQDKIRAEDIEREMRWREEEATRRQEADVKAAERESEKRGERESAVNRAKRFGDAIKASLFQMGHDAMEMPSFFRHVESVFSRFKVPGDLQADLLQPFLNAKARTIVARMDPLSSRRYETVRDLILKEHKLTPATYLEHFNCITRPENETCVMFGARLKALLEQYVRSRKVDASFEGLMSLLLSDRIKATLGDGCLRHILSVELHAERGWLDAGELAEAVDTYLANHFANDKPRATAIGQKFENFKTSPPSNNSYQKQETQSNSGQFRNAQNKKDDPMQYKQQKQSDSPAASNRKTGLCFNCRSTEHYKRDCPLLRQTHQSKNQKVNRCRITDTTEFENSEQKTKICEEQILKMDAGCQVENDNIVAVENCNFVQQDNIFRNVSPLKYIDVKIDEVANASIRALDDSGSEICVIKSSIIDHNTLAVLQPMGTVRLRGIVGAPIETKLVKLHVSLVSNGDANAENRLPIVCAVCPELNEDMILTSTIVKQLMYCSHVNAISADAGMQATANGADSSDLDDVDSLDDQTQTSSHSQGNPATSDGRVANTDILRQEQLNDDAANGHCAFAWHCRSTD